MGRATGLGAPKVAPLRKILIVALTGLLLCGFALTTAPSDARSVGAHPSPALAGEVSPANLDCGSVNTVGSLSILSPASDSGPAGTAYELQGSGFFIHDDVDIYVANATSGSASFLVGVNTEGTGAFTIEAVAPGSSTLPLGLYTFWAEDAEANCASADYSLTAVPPASLSCVDYDVASVEISSPSPANGPLGTPIDLQGTGYSTEGWVTFDWSNPSGTSSSDLGSAAAAGPKGQVSLSADAPSSGYAPGTYYIWAGDSYDDCAWAEFNLTASGPTLTFSPTSGPPATPVTVTGAGFGSYAGETLGPVELLTPSVDVECPTVVVSDAGAFSCPFLIPVLAAGDYSASVETSPDVFVSSTNEFTVTPQLILSPTGGTIGSTLTLFGTGFTVAGAVSAEFDSNFIECQEGAVNVDAYGEFTCEFMVPIEPPGNYAVTAYTGADGTVSAAGGFNVIVDPEISISPASGPVGSTFTMTGVGFTPFPATTVVETPPDTEQLPTGGSDCANHEGYSITLDDAGSFECTFSVPAGTAAGSTLEYTAIDTSTGDYATANFTVPPTLTITKPASLQLPGGGFVTVRGAGWPTPDGPYLTFLVLTSGLVLGAVYCASPPTISATGTFSCTFQIPDYFPGTYQVEVYDANNPQSVTSSNSFTVLAPEMIISSPATQKGPIGGSITLKGMDFDPNESSSLDFFLGLGGPASPPTSWTQFWCDAPVSISGAGSFTCTLTVPSSAVPGIYTIMANGTNPVFQDISEDTYTVGATGVTITGPATLSGPVGGSLTVTGYYFDPADSATLLFYLVEPGSQSSPPTVSCANSWTVDAEGTFTCKITVPSGTPAGVYAVNVEDVFLNQLYTSTNLFTVMSPSVTITAPSTLSGPVGASLTVTGYYFDPSDAAAITFYFAGQSASATAFTESCTNAWSISPQGTFTCRITLPSSAGPDVYDLSVEDSNQYYVIYATNQFTVVAPSLTITAPASLTGHVGSSLVLRGTWFDPSDAAALEFHLVGQAPGAPDLSVSCTNPWSISPQGAFTCKITVPSAAVPGVYAVYVMDENLLAGVSSTNLFTVE